MDVSAQSSSVVVQPRVKFRIVLHFLTSKTLSLLACGKNSKLIYVLQCFMLKRHGYFCPRLAALLFERQSFGPMDMWLVHDEVHSDAYTASYGRMNDGGPSYSEYFDGMNMLRVAIHVQTQSWVWIYLNLRTI